MTFTPNRPDLIGAYMIDGVQHFHAVTFPQIDRSGSNFSAVIATFGFKPEEFILSVSMLPESIYFSVFESALQKLGIYGTNADDSPFDAGRVESLSRQMDYAAACGVSAQVIAGLKQFGHDPAKVFAGRTIWARPDAVTQLAQLGGFDVRRFVPLGPAFALECSHGGVHVDDTEWQFSDDGGTIHVTSRMDHVEPVSALDTKVAGKLGTAPCGCGLSMATLDFA